MSFALSKLEVDKVRHWIEMNLSVQARDRAGTAPAVLNASQLWLHYNSPAVALEEDQTCVVKPRQIGSSTYFLCLAIALCKFRPGINILWVNVDEESEVEIHAKFGIILQSSLTSPGGGMPLVTAESRDRIEFANGSRIKWSRAGERVSRGSNLGRGGTFHFVVCCEFAYWADPAGAMEALGPALEHSNPSIIYDSTANGTSGPARVYYDIAKRGYDGHPGYTTFVFPWFLERNYRLAISKEQEQELLGTLTEDEMDTIVLAAERYNVEITASQLAWYRSKQAQYAALGKRNKVREIYPKDFDDAFIDKTACIFDAAAMRLHGEKFATIEGWRGLSISSEEFWGGHTRPSIDLTNQPCWESSSHVGFLRMYERPKPGVSYRIGIDCASGDAEDATAIIVLDENFDMKMLIEVRAHPRIQASYATAAGLFYNYAKIGIEKASSGELIKSLMEMTMTEEEADRFGGSRVLCRPYTSWVHPSSPYGNKEGHINTNVATKPALVKLLLEVVDDGGTPIKDRRLYEQLQLFIRDDKGRHRAAAGHDDLVMAFGIALAVVNLSRLESDPERAGALVEGLGNGFRRASAFGEASGGRSHREDPGRHRSGRGESGNRRLREGGNDPVSWDEIDATPGGRSWW